MKISGFVGIEENNNVAIKLEFFEPANIGRAGEWPGIDKSRPCSYHKTYSCGKWNGDTIPIKVPISTSEFTDSLVEYIVITLRQIMAIKITIERRYKEEGQKTYKRESAPRLYFCTMLAHMLS